MLLLGFSNWSFESLVSDAALDVIIILQIVYLQKKHAWDNKLGCMGPWLIQDFVEPQDF